MTQHKGNYQVPLFRQRYRYYTGQSGVPAKAPDDKVRTLAAISEAEVEELRADLEATIIANEEKYQQHRGWYNEMLGDANLLYGESSNAYKYLRRSELAPQKYRFGYYDHDPRREFELFTDCIQWCREAIEKHEGQAEREAQQAAEKQEWLQKAIAYLVAHGKVIGTDFTLYNAVAHANELAYSLAVEERLAVMQGFTPFDGDDGCEDCRGWDGRSNRCDCGNRRVYWGRSDYHTFEEPCIYAEVY